MDEDILKKFNFFDFVINETDNYWKQITIVIQKTHLLTNKYPKLILFSICIILAIFIFQNEFFSEIILHLGYLEYAGVFITGLFFSFGFSTPFATAVFILLKPENIILTSLIAGTGSLISDLIIFKFVKFSFEEEFKKLKKERPFLFIKQRMDSKFHPTHVNYVTLIFAGILLASPLPDEAGITILSGIAKINLVKLAILSFIFKTLGIFVLLTL